MVDHRKQPGNWVSCGKKSLSSLMQGALAEVWWC